MSTKGVDSRILRRMFFWMFLSALTLTGACVSSERAVTLEIVTRGSSVGPVIAEAPIVERLGDILRISGVVRRTDAQGKSITGHLNVQIMRGEELVDELYLTLPVLLAAGKATEETYAVNVYFIDPVDGLTVVTTYDASSSDLPTVERGGSAGNTIRGNATGRTPKQSGQRRQQGQPRQQRQSSAPRG